MKIKFSSFGSVNEYARQIRDIESDIMIRSGSYAIDGKSILAIYSLDLSKVLDLEVIEKVPGDTERVFKMLDSFGIVEHGE